MAVEERDCEKCGAAAGERCTSSNGGRLSVRETHKCRLPSRDDLLAGG
jgi:hypothetical protein